MCLHVLLLFNEGVEHLQLTLIPLFDIIVIDVPVNRFPVLNNCIPLLPAQKTYKNNIIEFKFLSCDAAFLYCFEDGQG